MALWGTYFELAAPSRAPVWGKCGKRPLSGGVAVGPADSRRSCRGETAQRGPGGHRETRAGAGRLQKAGMPGGCLRATKEMDAVRCVGGCGAARWRMQRAALADAARCVFCGMGVEVTGTMEARDPQAALSLCREGGPRAPYAARVTPPPLRGRPARLPSRHGVISAAPPRVAAQQPPQGKPGAFERAVAAQCFQRILAACGRETAGGWCEGRDAVAVEEDGKREPPCHHAAQSTWLVRRFHGSGVTGAASSA